ncbi:hypothetical protein TNCV_1389411 [Trichonephila clavipes]|nr:hypothetical protein TNCV_1389411 [Trichonephila clavipes]
MPRVRGEDTAVSTVSMIRDPKLQEPQNGQAKCGKMLRDPQKELPKNFDIGASQDQQRQCPVCMNFVIHKSFDQGHLGTDTRAGK